MIRLYNSLRFGLLCCALATVLCACSSDEPNSPAIPKPQQEDPNTKTRTRVNIVSRAASNSDTDGVLQAGLYMVNYVEGRPDELLSVNNYVDNQLLTWRDGAWLTTNPIYWYDMDTKADFYAYAPYQVGVADVRQMPFSIKADQRSEEAFAMSDLLWGCVEGQSPTASSFDLTLAHRLAQMTIRVTADAGFEAGELRPDDVSVAIGGSRTDANVDLKNGQVTAVDGSVKDVVCHSNGDLSYTAILIPQQVPFSNLIQVNWNGNRYNLQNSFLLEHARQYTLTVKLKKTKSGFDIGIEGWDIIPEDFGGVIGG